MNRLRSSAPSPTALVAFLALFLALSGTVYAGVKIAKNSVGSGEIKNGSVKGGDLADDTVTGEQVAESTLGVVPRAATAGTATAAASAANAGSAKTADRATSAATADRAAYADRAASAGSADRATVADRATSAASADRAATAGSATEAAHAASADQVGGHPAGDFASSASVFPVAVRLAAGETKTLVSRDGLKLDARCTINESVIDSSSTATVLRIYASSSVDGATLQSPQKTYDGSSTDKTVGPSTTASVAAVVSAATTGSKIERVPVQSNGGLSGGIIFTSAAGTSIFFGSTGAIRVGLYVGGAVCSVSAPVMIATP